jgi:hypothetical protein
MLMIVCNLGITCGPYADMKSLPRGRSETPLRSSRIEATLLTSHHPSCTHTNSCSTPPTHAISRSLLQKSGGKKQDTCYASGSSHKHGTYLIPSDTAASTPITLGLMRTEWCACPCAVRMHDFVGTVTES